MRGPRSIDLQDRFDRFDQAITLKARQVERMDSASTALRRYLVECFGLSDESVFEQGEVDPLK